LLLNDRRTTSALAIAFRFFDQVFKHHFSDLVFDGDRGRKLESSSKSMRVRCVLMGGLERSAAAIARRPKAT
jgi:hypothetical protein